MNWHEFFIKLSQCVAEKSKDTSTKVGAVIVGQDNEVLSIGYNGFPRGVSDVKPERFDRPLKYKFTAHAEANAVFNAARQGIRLKGATLYFNFYPIPCSECAKAIIQSGIARIVGPNIPFPGKGEQWEEDLKVSESMLKEAGVEFWVDTNERQSLPEEVV